METFKAIIEVLPAISAIVIGVAVACIAWQQHQTNKNRLKMELFDRRYKIYEAIVKLTTNKFTDFNEVMWLHHHRDIASAPFLFNSDSEVLDFIHKVNEAAFLIIDFKENYGVDYSEEQEPAIKQLCKNLWNLQLEATKVFSKDLTLNA